MTKSSTEDAIGLTRVHRWAPIPVQTERLEAAGVRRIVSLDKITREQLVRMIRDRTVLKVLHASFLIDPHKRGAIRRLNDYQKFAEELANLPRKCRGIVLDVDSGFLADTAPQRRAMVALVREQIAKDLRGKASASNGKRGGQPLKLSGEQKERGRGIWMDVVRFPTWDDAELELKKQVHKDFTKWRANREYGLRPTRPKR